MLPVETPVVPIVSSWIANGLADTAKFVFKVKLFVDEMRSPADSNLAYMSFIQGVYEVITGVLPVTADEAISLAALQMQAKFGPHKPGTHTKGFLSRSGQLKGMVPGTLLMTRAMAAWDEDILVRHRMLNADARARPMQLYCQMLMTREFYGAEYFAAAQVYSSAHPESVILAVGLTGVHLLTMQKRQIDRFSFAEVYRWGFTAEKSFYVELKPHCSRPGVDCSTPATADAGNRFVFTTKEGRHASDLLTAYATQILAQIRAKGTAGAAAASAAKVKAPDVTGTAAASAALTETEAAVRIQALIRGSQARWRLQEGAAATRMQAMVRGFLARSQFDRMLEEMEAELG
jgi:hypothetical protein